MQNTQKNACNLKKFQYNKGEKPDRTSTDIFWKEGELMYKKRFLRLVSAVLALCMMAALLPTAAFAADPLSPGTTFSYEYQDKTLKYTVNADGNGTTVSVAEQGEDAVSGDVVIPATVYDSAGTSYSVTSIGDRAFYDCYWMTSITIPSGVESIGISAFNRCDRLTDVIFEANSQLTSIGNWAFVNGAMKELVIPEKVHTIGNYVFKECGFLQTVTIPDSVESVGSEIFDFAFEKSAKTIIYGGTQAKWEKLGVQLPEGSTVQYTSHTVKFDPNGHGTAPENIYVKNGETIPADKKPADPTETGYTFKGWYYTENGVEKAFEFGENGTKVTSSMTLKARWEINYYTVTFDANNGDGKRITETVQHGEKVTAPEDPKIEGYIFDGWYEYPNGTGEKFDPNRPVTETKVYYAHWTKKETLTASDFTFTPPESLEYNGEVKTAKVEAGKTGIGKITIKYYHNDNDEVFPIDPGTYTVKINVEEGAQYKGDRLTDEGWKFTITKGTLQASMFDFTAPSGLTYDGQPKKAVVTAKSGYADRVGHVTVKYYKEDDTVGTTTIPTEPGTYAVKIDVDDTGTLYGKATDLTADNWSFTITKAGLTPANLQLNRETQKMETAEGIEGAGEITTKWYAVENGQPTGEPRATLDGAKAGPYQAEAVIAEGSNYKAVTLTDPGWQIFVAATLEPGKPIFYDITVKNGTTNVASAKKGDLIKLFANEAPEGEEFDCWKVNGAKIEGDSFEMPAENVTAEAVYKAKTYSVVFVTAHDNTPNSLTVKHGETIAGDRVLKADGYEFGGWYNGTEKFVFGENGTKVTGNLTLTARWTEVKKPEPKPDPKPVVYEIVVDNGTAYLDDGATAIHTAEEGQTVILKVNPEALTEGFVFDKWEIVSGEVKLADATASETRFEMPASAVELKATVKAVESPAAPAAIHPASVMAGTVVLGAGAVSVGWSAYHIATELYLKWVLPQGVIPTTRGQLALLLWNQADQPAAESTALYTDIDASDEQTAARWVIENKKMELVNSDEADVFEPDLPVDIFAVAKAWRKK